MTIQRDEFYSAVNDLKDQARQTREELGSISREIRDLQQQQNGKLNNTITDVAVLKVQVGDLTSSIKDSTARYLAVAGIMIGALVEIIRYVASHAKMSP